MEDCIFCKIVNGEIPSTKVFESDTVYAFEDINPQAKVHVIIIPKKHYKDILEFNDASSEIYADIINAISKIAKIKGVDESGFRIINNCGKDASQTVNHVHFHLLGKTKMKEKMI